MFYKQMQNDVGKMQNDVGKYVVHRLYLAVIELRQLTLHVERLLLLRTLDLAQVERDDADLRVEFAQLAHDANGSAFHEILASSSSLKVRVECVGSRWKGLTSIPW